MTTQAYSETRPCRGFPCTGQHFRPQLFLEKENTPADGLRQLCSAHPSRAGTDSIASSAGGLGSPRHSGAALLAERLPVCAEPAPGIKRGFQPPGLLIHLLWPVPCSGNTQYQCLYCRGRSRGLQRLAPRCGLLQAGGGTLANLQKRSSSQPQPGM